jgi:hypothetical protein
MFVMIGDRVGFHDSTSGARRRMRKANARARSIRRERSAVIGAARSRVATTLGERE